MRLLRFLLPDTRHQLRELYRSAEEGSRTPEVDLASRQTFEADQKLISQLRQLATLAEPSNLSVERGNLLARVAQKKGREAEEQVPVLRRILHKRTIALAGATIILAGAAATVGAAGGVSDVAGTVDNVLTALHITDRTPDETDGHIDGIEQPEGLDLQPEDAPPVDAPPGDLPADAPPAGDLPADAPPVGDLPADAPPVGDLPVDAPPVDAPPFDTPPADPPPVGAPPIDTPPVEAPPIDSPPVDAPPFDAPPVDVPPGPPSP